MRPELSDTIYKKREVIAFAVENGTGIIAFIMLGLVESPIPDIVLVSY